MSAATPGARRLPARHCHLLARQLLLALSLLVLMGKTLAPAAQAQGSSAFDSSEQIAIEADSAEQDEKTGVTTYSGSVAIVQGPLSIVADRVRIVSKTVGDNRVVEAIHAEGQPALFTHNSADNSENVTARASNIEYLLEMGKINLQGKASLLQQGSSVSGDLIEYFIDQKRVKARADDSTRQGGGRVRTVITPGAGILFENND